MGIADGKDPTPFIEGNNNKEDNTQSTDALKKNVDGEQKDITVSSRRTRNKGSEMPSDNANSASKVGKAETSEDVQGMDTGRASRSSGRGKAKQEAQGKQKGKGKDNEVKGRGKDNEVKGRGKDVVKGKGKDTEAKGKQKANTRRRSRRSKRGKEEDEEDEDDDDDEEEEEDIQGTDEEVKNPSLDVDENVSNDGDNVTDNAEAKVVSPADVVVEDESSDVEMKDDTDITDDSQIEDPPDNGEVEKSSQESMEEATNSQQLENSTEGDIEMKDISSHQEDEFEISTQDQLEVTKDSSQGGDLDVLSQSDGENADSSQDVKVNESSQEEGELPGSPEYSRENKDSPEDDKMTQDSSQDGSDIKDSSQDVSLDYDESSGSSQGLGQGKGSLDHSEINDSSQDSIENKDLSLEDSKNKDMPQEHVPDEECKNMDTSQEHVQCDDGKKEDMSQEHVQCDGKSKDTSQEHVQCDGKNKDMPQENVQDMESKSEEMTQEHLQDMDSKSEDTTKEHVQCDGKNNVTTQEHVQCDDGKDKVMTQEQLPCDDGKNKDMSQEHVEDKYGEDKGTSQDHVQGDENDKNKNMPQEIVQEDEDHQNKSISQESAQDKDTSLDYSESKDSSQEDSENTQLTQEHEQNLDSSLESCEIKDSSQEDRRDKDWSDESRQKDSSPEYGIIKDFSKKDNKSAESLLKITSPFSTNKQQSKGEKASPQEDNDNKHSSQVNIGLFQGSGVDKDISQVNGKNSFSPGGVKVSQRKIVIPFSNVESSSKPAAKPAESLRNMLEDIEEGELDYEEEGEVPEEEEDLPDLPEYDPSAHKKANGYGSEEGEILSETEQEEEEREDGEIRDDDETGQVYICVDPLNDKWKKVSREEQKKLAELEEGQIEEADDTKRVTPLPSTNSTGDHFGGGGGGGIGNANRFIPRTLCKYYNNGLCRWGATCRFLHPGINDKGIPSDLQPSWNAAAASDLLPQDRPADVPGLQIDKRGNYVMHRPPGMYPNAYGKAPPPMECINVPVMPTPIVDMALLPPGHTAEILALPVGMVGERHPMIPIPIIKETAWEKGLRRAKEIKEVATRRREEDTDFEQKRLSMRIPEHVIEKVSDFEPGADPQLSAEKALNEWGIRKRESREPFERRHHGDDRRSDRYGSMYADRFSRQQKGHIDRSSGRARMADMGPQHPMRREERQRQRERERRERDEKDKEVTEKDRLKIESIYKGERLLPEMVKPITDPRIARQQLTDNTNTPMPVKVPKTVGATEWHDPWMRSQQPPSAQVKSEIQKQPGVEAISDSDSSSSDSDSDSDSSSTDKSSGSDSDSSSSSDGEPKKLAVGGAAIKIEDTTKNGSLAANKTDTSDPSRKERRPPRTADEKQPTKEKAEKTEPLSYEEWKRIQTIQKAQYHQQMANQYKTALESKDVPPKKEMSPMRIKEVSRIPKVERQEDPKQPVVFEPPKHVAAPVKRENQIVPPTLGETTEKTATLRNEEKFDSPKKVSEKKDSESGSDSDSDSDSDSGSSNSDSDDSDSDSESDAEVAAKLAAKSTPLDPAARKDLLNTAEKPKPEVEIASFAGKRPARKDELLKELKAVEDAIARKRAKID